MNATLIYASMQGRLLMILQFCLLFAHINSELDLEARISDIQLGDRKYFYKTSAIQSLFIH